MTLSYDAYTSFIYTKYNKYKHFSTDLWSICLEMVKNKIGGNRAKKGARKNLNEGAGLMMRKLRMIEDDDEKYGIVTKMIGNGQVIVLCHDGKERLGFIRYKFSGRNKHGNLITCGCWVIIGCRSWETTLPDKLEKADLLEIYTHQEKTRLVQECKTNVSALLQYEQQQIMGGELGGGGSGGSGSGGSVGGSGGGNGSDDIGIVFSYDESVVNELEGVGGDGEGEGNGEGSGEDSDTCEINFDDI
jgi:initiation factor 1A